MLECRSVLLSSSYLHPHFIFLWMRRDTECWDAAIGCKALIQSHTPQTHTHTHTHTEKERGDVMLPFRSASRESDCLWLMLETSRERASGEGSLFILIFSLAAPGAQWCNTGDLFVTDHPRFLLAADWPGARMNEPLCSLWGGGLGGVRQKHVTCSLRGKKRKWRKNCWLPWQPLWMELKWVCTLISLFVTHVGRMHEGDSECSLYSACVCVCCWIYIINHCMVLHYRQWECNSYCFTIIVL